MNEILSAAGLSITESFLGMQGDVVIIYGAMFVILLLCLGTGLVVYALNSNRDVTSGKGSSGGYEWENSSMSAGDEEMERTSGSIFNNNRSANWNEAATKNKGADSPYHRD